MDRGEMREQFHADFDAADAVLDEMVAPVLGKKMKVSQVAYLAGQIPTALIENVPEQIRTQVCKGILSAMMKEWGIDPMQLAIELAELERSDDGAA